MKKLIVVIISVSLVTIFMGCDINTWMFTSDNAQFTTSAITLDFKALGIMPGTGFEDNVTDSTYSIEQKTYGATIQTYEFVKVTDTKLDYSVIQATTIGPIRLIKE